MPTYTEILESWIPEAYRVADALMAEVKDDDLAWKPATGKNWMTTGQLLRHITEACGLCCRGFVTGDWGLPDDFDPSTMSEQDMLPPAEKLPTVDSVQQARDLLAADREVAVQMVRQAGEERLATEVTPAPWDPQHPKPLGEHLMGMVLHLNQHKGQLFYYLKLMGRDVNTMHLWGV